MTATDPLDAVMDVVVDAVAEAMIEHGPDGHTDGAEIIARAALTAAYPVIREGIAAEVVSGVRKWCAINEIAEAPLDWAGLGEFLSRVEER